eukprot:TRINITY_DN41332_c1_g1_i1.p1 TRINITY_DN41332_c1_g1~~TRINITY_DN41332_c1_g1_i1.p1  ORF type:complete len:200 (+),score=-11.54 TRINITY_DN41332_c1_g1_i1:233-832(+)
MHVYVHTYMHAYVYSHIYACIRYKTILFCLHQVGFLSFLSFLPFIILFTRAWHTWSRNRRRIDERKLRKQFGIRIVQSMLLCILLKRQSESSLYVCQQQFLALINILFSQSLINEYVTMINVFRNDPGFFWVANTDSFVNIFWQVSLDLYDLRFRGRIYCGIVTNIIFILSMYGMVHCFRLSGTQMVRRLQDMSGTIAV